MLAEATLVHVELSADWARVVGVTTFGWKSQSPGVNHGIHGVITSAHLPGTPEALGSLCTNFMCSMRDSPLTHSFWHMGQQLGFGPPTKAVCYKQTPKKYLRRVRFNLFPARLQQVTPIVFT